MLVREVEQIPPSTVKPIVHVISDAGPHPYFRTLIEAGGVEPESVIVGCVGSAGPLQRDMRALGVESFALGATGRRQHPLAVARLARLLTARRAQVLQSHLVDGSLVGLAAARLAGVPISVFTAHHSHELPYHGRRLVWADRLCAGPLCDHVIAPSRQVAETLTRYTGVESRKLAVVHHGFDLDRLDPGAVGGESVRAELGLRREILLGAVGRIYRLKNYANLLRAFAEVNAGPEVRLAIAGGGSTQPLRQLAEDLGIGDRVALLGPRADVPAFLAACDAFVHPAAAESFGMVIIEAMAMGKPLMTTPVGIAPEVITAGETGLLAADGSVPALRAGLAELLTRREAWPRLGRSARARVQGFTAAAMASEYVALYDAWLSGARAGRQAKWIPAGRR